MRVIVASKNPVKINATQLGFESYFSDTETIGMSAPSEVSDQPMSDVETLQGALNRVKNAKKQMPNADYWVGIEGGIQQNGSYLEAFAWVVISNGGKIGKSRTTTFQLPEKIAELIEQGYELGIANDILFKQENSKQKTGAVGLLTKKIISRTTLYKQAIELALIPFVNVELY